MQMQQSDPSRSQGNSLPAQNVPQIRSTQVNISQQQQRMPAPMAPGQPLSPQMMIQAQQAQARVMAQAQAHQAHAQAQAQVQAQSQGTNVGANVPPHMSPHTNRGATSSPAVQQASPPRLNPTPNNDTNSPRPPSAQRNAAAMNAARAVAAGMGTNNPIPNPANPMARHSNAMAAYFPNIPNGQYSQEQMTQMLRIQMLTQVRPAHCLFNG